MFLYVSFRSFSSYTLVRVEATLANFSDDNNENGPLTYAIYMTGERWRKGGA